MRAVDDLWFLADAARQQAERSFYRLRESHEGYLETSHETRVSRRRFRTLADRIERTGAPYGAHSLVYRPSGELLLCRHAGVGLWVLPGGGVEADESFRETAGRELDEEAGIDAEYEGLGMLSRVEIRCDDYRTWGVLPVFAARARTHEPDVCDPDGEIREARWFSELPSDTRDREDLRAWREHALE
jgi:8-oxo-dGTP diphosphatase